jgi:hypothetical protein
MPQGRYTVFDGEGSVVGAEGFRCAPGPMGWRYFSEVDTALPSAHHETVDIAVDADWRIARVRVDTGDHDVLLQSQGHTLTGFRDGAEIEIEYGPEVHLDYFTPATNVISSRRLSGTAEIDVVYLEPATLVPSHVRQRYELIGEGSTQTPVGTFAAARWTYTSLDSGWSADLWVAGDVLVRYESLFELERYEPGASGPRSLDG